MREFNRFYTTRMGPLLRLGIDECEGVVYLSRYGDP